ncbi:MAG: hypothetical protein JKY65_25575 [Planctomycetes bacterium]|nr:hypothetical protein [Planctomycetota bacterium]
MNTTKRLLTLTIALCLSATLFAGCSNKRRSTTSTTTAPVTTGIVGQLTGDADDEVSAATQLLVAQAVALDENDIPLDF